MSLDIPSEAIEDIPESVTVSPVAEGTDERHEPEAVDTTTHVEEWEEWETPSDIYDLDRNVQAKGFRAFFDAVSDDLENALSYMAYLIRQDTDETFLHTLTALMCYKLIRGEFDVNEKFSEREESAEFLFLTTDSTRIRPELKAWLKHKVDTVGMFYLCFMNPKDITSPRHAADIYFGGIISGLQQEKSFLTGSNDTVKAELYRFLDVPMPGQAPKNVFVNGEEFRVKSDGSMERVNPLPATAASTESDEDEDDEDDDWESEQDVHEPDEDDESEEEDVEYVSGDDESEEDEEPPFEEVVSDYPRAATVPEHQITTHSRDSATNEVSITNTNLTDSIVALDRFMDEAIATGQPVVTAVQENVSGFGSLITAAIDSAMAETILANNAAATSEMTSLANNEPYQCEVLSSSLDRTVINWERQLDGTQTVLFDTGELAVSSDGVVWTLEGGEVIRKNAVPVSVEEIVTETTDVPEQLTESQTHFSV